MMLQERYANINIIENTQVINIREVEGFLNSGSNLCIPVLIFGMLTLKFSHRYCINSDYANPVITISNKQQERHLAPINNSLCFTC